MRRKKYNRTNKKQVLNENNSPTQKKIKHITDLYEGLGYYAPLLMCTVISISNNCVLYVKKEGCSSFLIFTFE